MELELSILCVALRGMNWAILWYRLYLYTPLPEIRSIRGSNPTVTLYISFEDFRNFLEEL